jgi:polyisoprenoid-binding protein YceI
MDFSKRLKTLAIFALALAVAGLAGASDTWKIDTAHSGVDFKIRHLMSKTSGQFGTFDGTIVTDFENLDQSSVQFVIDAASIDTDNADRDKHLRSADFFDVESHPEITFVGERFTKVGENEYEVTGELTMHGVTKTVTLPVTFLGAMQDPWGNTKAGFEIVTEVNRKDYGITWNKAMDAGSLLLGENVEIVINLQVQKQ